MGKNAAFGKSEMNILDQKAQKIKQKRKCIDQQILEAEIQLQQKTEAFLRRCPLVHEFHLECKDKQKELERKIDGYKKSRGMDTGAKGRAGSKLSGH